MTDDYEPLPWEKSLGYRVDPKRCRAQVHERYRFYQCARKVKDGQKYCATHDPVNVAKRRADADARYNDKQATEKRRNAIRYARPLIDALKAIASGHNDPRTLAEETLAEFGIEP